MGYQRILLVVLSIVEVVSGSPGSINTIDPDLVSWCWTSTGYDDYSSCARTLLDNNRATIIDMSSKMSEPSPTWVTMTFYSFTDVTGVEVLYTGAVDLVYTFVFSDGTSEQAAEQRSTISNGGRDFLAANGYFSRRITRSLTINIQGRTVMYQAVIHDVSVIGGRHQNLERISDWEHGAKCRQDGRDCSRLVNGFVDREYKLGVSQSALIYLNESYPISHLTLLEALPELGDSIYDRMAVTLGNPTGFGFHTETFEFSLCKQKWSENGPVWQQIILPKPTNAMYVNITILGKEEKIVNGLYEMEVYRSKDGSRYRAQDQPCVSVKQVDINGCEVSCDCEDLNPKPAKQESSSNQPIVEDSDHGNIDAPIETEPESAASSHGMPDESKLMFALCGTAGLAVGCLVGWTVTCAMLCRMRRNNTILPDRSSQQGSRKHLWEERASVSSSEASTPEGSLRKLRREESTWVHAGATQKGRDC